MEMVKDSTISFQTSSEICRHLEKLAEQEKQSVPSFVEAIVCSHLKEKKLLEGIVQSRRRSERIKVGLPAFIGDSRWQRWEFIAVNIIDLSFGGICFSAPKGIGLVIESNSETAELNVIFTLPKTLWPIKVKFQPQRVIEGADTVQVGATLVNPDFYACTALQKYLMTSPPTQFPHFQPAASENGCHQCSL